MLKNDRYVRKGAAMLILLVMLVCLPLTSMAGETTLASGKEQNLQLPANTVTIDAYAFHGNTAITKVTFPDGLETIGAYAFAGCSGLSRVYIPSSVESIGTNAFPKNTVIDCEDGSYAAQWAELNGYTRKSKYFALLVGQEYTSDANNYLPGCFRDVDSMKAMLNTMTGTEYEITVCKDRTASGILSAIKTAFASADENSVCLFYYSGHGVYSVSSAYLGALVGTDMQFVTMNQLKNALDAVKGEKIVILDSCYSGAAISSSGSTITYAARSVSEPDIQAINEAIIQAFSVVPRAGLASGGYYVLTAASANESSYSSSNGSYFDPIYCGVFTKHLLYGSGYDEVGAVKLQRLYADNNGDSKISLSEAHSYAYSNALADGVSQHAQCYPTGSDYVLWSR